MGLRLYSLIIYVLTVAYTGSDDDKKVLSERRHRYFKIMCSYCPNPPKMFRQQKLFKNTYILASETGFTLSNKSTENQIG